MAAGLGFKTFTTGEVLTAADVNGYLMQGVLVFASAAARNAAITSPQEGQFAFTKDTNGLWYYDGAAWVASGATGDIEGVTAGTGITGGGTSGTVTITNDMATTITAAGDIVVGTGSGTYDNLPIGTTAQVLTADTTVSPYKVKWAAASGGSTPSFTLINAGGTALTGATSITVSGISGKNSLLIWIAGGSAGANSDFLMTLNGDTSGKYNFGGMKSTGTTITAGAQDVDGTAFGCGGQGSNASDSIYCAAIIDGANAAGVKTMSFSNYAGGTTNNNTNSYNGFYAGTSTISSVTVASDTGNWDAGTIYVYGA